MMIREKSEKLDVIVTTPPMLTDQLEAGEAVAAGDPLEQKAKSRKSKHQQRPQFKPNDVNKHLYHHLLSTAAQKVWAYYNNSLNRRRVISYRMSSQPERSNIKQYLPIPNAKQRFYTM